jgi:hypothetical protein
LSKENRNQDEERDLKNHEKAIRDVYRLANADALGDRVFGLPTQIGTIAAIAFGVAAVVVLLLAPETEKPSGPRLVSVTLTPAGARAFGCVSRAFKAIRIGGTDEKPQVVTLDAACARGRLLELTVKAKTPTAKEVTNVEPLKG